MNTLPHEMLCSQNLSIYRTDRKGLEFPFNQNFLSLVSSDISYPKAHKVHPQ